jgi:hypothetical protein
MTEGPKQIDRAWFELLAARGKSLKYRWRKIGGGRYACVRPDGSVFVTFGPVHPNDNSYFDGLCDEERSRRRVRVCHLRPRRLRHLPVLRPEGPRHDVPRVPRPRRGLGAEALARRAAGEARPLQGRPRRRVFVQRLPATSRLPGLLPVVGRRGRVVSRTSRPRLTRKGRLPHNGVHGDNSCPRARRLTLPPGEELVRPPRRPPEPGVHWHQGDGGLEHR